MEKPKKPHLSDSALNMLYRCAMQYFFRFQEGIKIPPGIAQVIGRSVHGSVHLDLQYKIETGRLRKLDEIQDAARDHVNRAWQEGVRLVGEELKESQKKLKGNAVDQATALCLLHHNDLAPTINPVQVESFFRL